MEASRVRRKSAMAVPPKIIAMKSLTLRFRASHTAVRVVAKTKTTSIRTLPIEPPEEVPTGSIDGADGLSYGRVDLGYREREDLDHGDERERLQRPQGRRGRFLGVSVSGRLRRESRHLAIGRSI